MNIAELGTAYAEFLEAGESAVATSSGTGWGTGTILAHVMASSRMLAAASAELLAGRIPVVGNRPTQFVPNEGRTRRIRSVNSHTAGVSTARSAAPRPGTGSGSSGSTCSAASPRRCRLVATTRMPGQRAAPRPPARTSVRPRAGSPATRLRRGCARGSPRRRTHSPAAFRRSCWHWTAPGLGGTCGPGQLHPGYCCHLQ